jgi:hypothetical protein
MPVFRKVKVEASLDEYSCLLFDPVTSHPPAGWQKSSSILYPVMGSRLLYRQQNHQQRRSAKKLAKSESEENDIRRIKCRKTTCWLRRRLVLCLVGLASQAVFLWSQANRRQIA